MRAKRLRMKPQYTAAVRTPISVEGRDHGSFCRLNSGSRLAVIAVRILRHPRAFSATSLQRRTSFSRLDQPILNLRKHVTTQTKHVCAFLRSKAPTLPASLQLYIFSKRYTKSLQTTKFRGSATFIGVSSTLR